MEIIVLYLPASAGRCSCCSAERCFPAPPALLVPAQWAGPAALPGRAEPAPRRGTETEPWQPFCCCCCWGHHDTAPMVLTSLPDTASLTLSIWTAWSVSAAYHFATDPSFSYSRAIKMLAERREISLHVFFFPLPSLLPGISILSSI